MGKKAGPSAGNGVPAQSRPVRKALDHRRRCPGLNLELLRDKGTGNNLPPDFATASPRMWGKDHHAALEGAGMDQRRTGPWEYGSGM